MASARRYFFIAVVLLGAWMIPQRMASLRPNYYDETCPGVEDVVRGVVAEKIKESFDAVPKLIHFYFQDCFLDGCSASILVRTPITNPAVATVVKAKAVIDSKPGCKNKVSCADIFNMAVRDAIYLAGGPYYKVELGRFDSLVLTNLNKTAPDLSFNLDQLTDMFAQRNINQKDMIALFGTHSVGHAHCDKFSNRIYNYSNSSPVDPTLNPQYAKRLQAECPVNVDPSVEVWLDPVTPQVFDNVYYQNLVKGMGLLGVDDRLFTDIRSMPVVVDFAQNAQHFNDAFSHAMVKLGRVGVMSSNDGNIRHVCNVFN
ncbi:hypothetical protein Droror1_Dr00010793 [Drosera rotundifolia]